ncbi:hypothetical protein FAI40_07310 [Acetobacteraceae bacterium]|nr:hypothetical protein FAI40_07310 [Acetobacteraceae bacterium]
MNKTHSIFYPKKNLFSVKFFLSSTCLALSFGTASFLPKEAFAADTPQTNDKNVQTRKGSSSLRSQRANTNRLQLDTTSQPTPTVTNINDGKDHQSDTISVGSDQGTGTLNIDGANSSATVGDSAGAATPTNGYVKVAAGSAVNITDGGSLKIDAQQSTGNDVNYPTLQIGTTSGQDAASVNMDKGSLDVSNGQIQVGDNLTSSAGGAASLNAKDSTITGGLQIGAGNNTSSNVSLTNTTYNDNGHGVDVGIRGTNNTLTQSGGVSNASNISIGGSDDGNGNGDKNAVGNASFTNGATLNAGDGKDGGMVVGDHGTGSANFDSSNLNVNGLVDVANNYGSNGTLTLQNNSKGKATNVIVGDGGKGTMNVESGSTLSTDTIDVGSADQGTGTLNIDGANSSATVGDSAGAATPTNGYVKVAAGSAVNITDGGSLKIDAQQSTGNDVNYPTLQIGTTSGQDAASVNMDKGSLDVSNGQIQVGDNLTSSAGGAASLNAKDSTITGGLQIGAGNNTSSNVSLTNTTYNDNGHGVDVGIRGTNNTLTQSGGVSNASNISIGGSDDGNGNGDKNAVGNASFTNGATLNAGDGKDGGMVVGDHGTGSANFDSSNLNVNGLVDVANNYGSNGTLTLQNNSKGKATNVIVGDGGKGTMNVESGSTLSTDTIDVGSADQGTGTLNIDGANSSATVGDSAGAATPTNGYVKVAAGSAVNITDGGSLKIDAQQSTGNDVNYPTLQIGTTSGQDAASVNMDKGSLDVSNGQIQVGDNLTSSAGGAASLNAKDSTITGGLQIGAGNNTSSNVSLTNTTYNDNGHGVDVGIRGTNNTLTQSGGVSNASNISIGGSDDGNGNGDKNAVGNASFTNGATLNAGDGKDGGMVVGDHGTGSANFDSSNLNVNGLVDVANNYGSNGTLTLQNNSKGKATNVIVGDGGKGTMNVESGSTLSTDTIDVGSADQGTGTLNIDGANSSATVGDSAGAATPTNGYVKVAAGSAVNITDGGSLKIDAQQSTGNDVNYPTLQIGTTSGQDAASVNMDKGSLDVSNGQIQVGDNLTSSAGGAASLNAKDSTITGGLQIGAGNNTSSNVSLTNTTYNDNGHGVDVGIRGTNNTLTQSGGVSNASNISIGGSDDGNGNGDKNAVGNASFTNGATLNAGDGKDGGMVVGDHGTGSANFDSSNLNVNGLVDVANNYGSNGTLTLQNNSKGKATNVIVGDGGKGTMNVESGSTLSTDTIDVGSADQGTGTLNIDGANSSATVGDSAGAATPTNGYVKVAAGSAVNITDGGSLKIDAQQSTGNDVNYPTLQIGTTSGQDAASVNMDKGSLDVSNGQIQVGDNLTSSAGGAASLNAKDSTITGGLQIGAGNNTSSNVSLTNTTYNDNGHGVDVGIRGTNNTLTQSGGVSNASNISIGGSDDGNGNGDKNAVGNASFTNGATLNAGDGKDGGMVVGDHGTGSANFDSSNLNVNGLVDVANNYGSNGTLTLQNNSKGKATNVIVGDGGKGTMNVESGSTLSTDTIDVGSADQGTGTLNIDGANSSATVGDSAGAATPTNGYVKVAAGSAVNITDGGSLKIDAQQSTGNDVNYPTLQIGTTSGQDAASVNMDKGSLDVSNGQIQVGDNLTSSAGGAASLNAKDSTITGGLQIGAGNNTSSNVSLTNTTYNDNGHGVDVGIRGTNNTLTQSGGVSNASNISIGGSDDGNGNGDKNAVGNASFTNGATLNAGDGKDGGMVVGDHGTGSANFDSSNLNVNGLVDVANNYGSNGTLTLQNNSKGKATNVIVGDGGKGTMNVESGSTLSTDTIDVGSADQGTGTLNIDGANSSATVGDSAGAATPTNGYVKVAAGSAVNITDGGSLKIDAQQSTGNDVNYPTLQIGTTSGQDAASVNMDKGSLDVSNGQIQVGDNLTSSAGGAASLNAKDSTITGGLQIGAGNNTSSNVSLTNTTYNDNGHGVDVGIRGTNNTLTQSGGVSNASNISIGGSDDGNGNGDKNAVGNASFTNGATLNAGDGKDGGMVVGDHGTGSANFDSSNLNVNGLVDVANNYGSNGTLTLQNNSKGKATNVIVGDGGKGTMNVESGSTLSTDTIDVGSADQGTGTLNIDGANSSATVGDSAGAATPTNGYVKVAAGSAVNITDGGSLKIDAQQSTGNDVNYPTLQIGTTSGQDAASVNMDKGSLDVSNGQIQVGDNLTSSAGGAASLNAKDSTITGGLQIGAGNNTSSNVSLTNTTYNDNGHGVDVGIRGTNNTLTQSGGVSNASNISIGGSDDGNGNGDKNAVGNASFTNGATLNAGDGKDGGMVVGDHGTGSANFDSSNLNVNGLVDVANNYGSNGTLTLQNNSKGKATNVIVGDGGKGTMNVESGSTLSTDTIDVGSADQGTGTLNIDGANSSATVGDSAGAATPTNGYVKVAAGSAVNITDGGSLKIDAQQSTGNDVNYPTLQIGTTSGQDAASVNMDKGSLDVSNGQIQVGDNLTSSAGGAASLNAKDSTITGGLQIGAGNNTSSNVSLTNTTYNDNGHGVDVGIRGTNNTLTQSGGVSNASNISIGGSDDGNGNGDKNAVGNASFTNGATLNAGDGKDGGMVVGDHGTGSANFDSSNLNVNGLVDVANNYGSNGTLTLQNNSKGKATNVIVGDGGKGTMNVESGSTLSTDTIDVGSADQGTGTLNIDGANSSATVGDSAGAATPTNGYVKVAAGSAVNITDGGSLKIDAQQSTGNDVNYPTLQIGTTSGQDAASVNMDKGSLDVSNGQIQVGDNLTSSAGGAASLNAKDSTITGGLQIGAGNNTSSNVSLTNTTYNDNGHGVDVGIRGTNNTLTQSGGVSNASNISIGGSDDGNGNGDKNAVGNASFTNGATLNAGDGKDGGMVVGDHGTGSANFDSSNLNVNGLVDVANNYGSNGTLTLQNNSKGKATNVIVGDGGKGTMNVESGSTLSTDTIDVGSADQGTGTLNIDGANSSATVGDSAGAATPTNGYVKVAAGSAVNITDGGSLKIDAQQSTGNDVNYPTLQIGTTSGQDAASVNMDKGSLDVSNGQIQVGDNLTSSAGGAASLNAKDSTITGGLQIGAGNNTSSNVSLTNTTYNDNGHGVDVGIRGTNNTLTQSGGVSNASNISIGGSDDGNGNGDKNAVGNASFTNGATLNAGDGKDGGMVVGDHGTGSANFDSSNLNVNGLVDVANNYGSNGTLTLQNNSKGKATNVIVGDGGKGTMNVESGSTLSTDTIDVGSADQGTGTLNIDGANSSATVGDSAGAATPTNGYVKVAAGSAVNITDGGSLKIDAQQSTGNDVNYPTLQIGTTSGQDAASVNMDKGSLDVSNGQIQVGDNLTSSAGGAASLNAKDSTITGGLQIGAGNNTSSNVSLTNTTYNDNGHGVDVGIRGTNNTLTQSGGVSNASNISIGGSDDGNGNGDKNAVGNASFTNGATLNAGDGKDGGMVVGDHGTGSANFDSSNLNVNGLVDVANNYGSNGTLTLQNNSKGKATNVIVGDGGKGTMNVESGSTLSTDTIDVGSADQGTGTLNIDGANSSATVGDSAGAATPTNGYVKVAAGSAVNITDGGSLKIDAQQSTGNDVNYPTLQIGTTSGQDAASVNMDKGSLDVSNGQIQVGDNLTSSAGGAASLNAKDSTITGGLQIGAGNNTSSNVSLTNTTYNDNGHGVDVGIRGTNNTLTQSGGVSNASNISIGGSDDGNGNGDKNAVGNASFTNGATLNAGDGKDGGMVVGDHGTGSANFDSSNLNVNGLVDVANNYGSNGTLTLQNNSKGKATNVIVGDGGKGTMNVDNSKMSVGTGGLAIGDAGLGDDGKPAPSGTGTVNLTNASNVTVDGATKVGTGGQGSKGTLNVSGSGSELSTGSLSVGANQGMGTVNITKGGSVQVSDSSANGLTIGSGNGTGIVNIAGKGSSLTWANNDLVLGKDTGSTGQLNLSNDATLNAQGFIEHGNGSASMSLSDSTLNATGNLSDNVDTSLSGQNNINTNQNLVQMDGKISGNGGFDKEGSGTLQINNTQNDYHGTTNINNGVLEGVGTIGGDLNMANGTTLRAGISSNPAVEYGRMHVNGNTVMQTGSTFATNLGVYPTDSGLTGKGSFTIQNGSTLYANVAEGAQLNIGQAYNVVHADGGVHGTFSHYEQDGKIGSMAADGYAALSTTGTPLYTADDVDIGLKYTTAKGGLSAGGDRNQTAMGNRLSGQVGGDSVLSPLANILAGSDNQQRLNNLTQLDGEISSDMRTGNINNNFWVRDSVNNRLDCLEDTFRQVANGKATTSNVCGVSGKKVNVWGNMYGGIGGQDGHSGWNHANRASERDAGFIWGVDGEIGSDGYAEDRWHVGMMMGYGSVMESAKGLGSSGESNNANIGMYFGKQVRFDNQNFFTFHGQFGYTWNIMSWHRSVNMQGAAAQYNETLHAHELGGTAHVSAEVAYKHVFNLWGTPLEIAPTGSITYLNYEQGSYHENGGILGLHGSATNTNVGYGFMGAKVATNFNIGTWVISPHGKFGYRRTFGANQSYTHVGFESLGTYTGTDPSVVGVPLVQDQALTELGFDVHPTDYFSFGANYVGLYGGHSQTMSGGQLSAKIAF